MREGIAGALQSRGLSLADFGIDNLSSINEGQAQELLLALGNNAAAQTATQDRALLKTIDSQLAVRLADAQGQFLIQAGKEFQAFASILRDTSMRLKLRDAIALTDGIEVDLPHRLGKVDVVNELRNVNIVVAKAKVTTGEWEGYSAPLLNAIYLITQQELQNIPTEQLSYLLMSQLIELIARQRVTEQGQPWTVQLENSIKILAQSVVEKVSLGRDQGETRQTFSTSDENNLEPVVHSDQPGVKRVGGIDLNPVTLDLQIKRDVNGIPLPVMQQPIKDMKIQGFIPVIINITPVSVPLLLGVLNKENKGKDDVSSRPLMDPIALKKE